jgi:glycosyltransferase involved in cell wall biosynthesis
MNPFFTLVFMNKKGTIILVSNTHWHHAWQTSNSVAAGLAARGYEVLFVEPLPKRWPRLSEARRVVGRLSGNSQLAGFVNQTVPEGVNLVSPLALPDIGILSQYLNQKIFIPLLAKHLRGQITASPLIMIHNLPLRAAVVLQRRLAPAASVYRCVYDWSQDPYSRRQLAEEVLLRQVDMVWADCEYNLKRVTAVHNRAVVVPPEVDLSLFTAVSYTRSGLARPLCVYFGTIGLSIDTDLLRKISQRYQLRLIGPARIPLNHLAEGTEIMGPVPHTQIPHLIQNADVLLLPYNAQPHMKGVIPAKLFECLITGKPTIATNLTTIDQYRDLVYICNGHEEVFHAIEASQTEDEALAAQRLAAAQENSQERQLDRMEHYLESLIAARQVK